MTKHKCAGLIGSQRQDFKVSQKGKSDSNRAKIWKWLKDK